MAVRYNEFKNLNTEVLVINPESVYTHKMLNEIELSNMVKDGVPFPMLSDETGSIGRSYGVFDENLGTTLRGTFIIDERGYIHAMELLTTPAGRSTSELLRKLQAFQTYVKTGELIPSDWQPGDKAIAEQIEAVGNIWRQWRPKENV
jgi:peroxiredoxin (alkyl hydroperoxide reductase subunit C)